MNYANFTKTELRAAIARGVRQLVLIGSRTLATEDLATSSDEALAVFEVDEQSSSNGAGTFVPTRFDAEGLAAALDRSSFSKLKASLFVWLGSSYRTADAALSTLAFIASLPKGSGVLFDYAPERSSSGCVTVTALDALSSRIACASGAVKHLIQPQAVSALLCSLGFGQMTDCIGEEFSAFEGHIVSALI